MSSDDDSLLVPHAPSFAGALFERLIGRPRVYPTRLRLDGTFAMIS